MADKKYQYGTDENRAFLKEQAESLILFGKDFVSPTGGSYWLGEDGTPWKDRNRETWITCRMTHVYSIGALLGGVPGLTADECRDRAAKAIAGLRSELHDDENDGWFAAVTADGQKVGPKQCYAHAFVCLAATSGILADVPGAKELLANAESVYDAYFWLENDGLACDTWNTDFSELDSYRGINANMHSVECFLAIADAVKDEQYRERAGRIIAHVVNWARENSWRIPEHYTDAWVPDLECNKDKPDDQFKPYGATPGHGIEWSRLVTQWAASALDKDREEYKSYIDAAEHLYRRAVLDGWNADGAPGIVYTTDWAGKPVVHDRMHWTLAEAINTSSVLYRVTGKQEYADDYTEFLRYLDDKVIDHVNGSWFHQLDAENNEVGTVWPGKSDIYHALQSMLIPYYETDLSIATAVRNRNRDAKIKEA